MYDSSIRKSWKAAIDQSDAQAILEFLVRAAFFAIDFVGGVLLMHQQKAAKRETRTFSIRWVRVNTLGELRGLLFKRNVSLECLFNSLDQVA